MEAGRHRYHEHSRKKHGGKLEILTQTWHKRYWVSYKKQRRAKCISQEVLELSVQKRQIKAVRTHSEENRKSYNKIVTRETKKKRKQRKEQWLEERCLEVENSE